MSNTINAKLYKIQNLQYQDFETKEDFINLIVQKYNDKIGPTFENITLNENINQIVTVDNVDNNDFFDAKLFALNTVEKTPDWINFAASISPETDKLDTYKNRYSSFLLFIYDDVDIYAISKGYYGHHLLNEYIDIFFGMEVLSRLIDKSSTEIRQIEDRALFGSELGAQRYFRENYNLVYDDDFGKIYKAMLASIREEDFAKLGIVKKRESTKQVSISGSSSLDISTNFTYRELLKRITNIKKLLLTPGVEFNQFYRVPTKELTSIKDKLNTEILKMAYTNYISSEDVDFYHPQIFEYLNSMSTKFINQELGTEIEIERSASKKFKELIDEIGEDSINVTSEENFIDSLVNTVGSYKLNEESEFKNEISLKDWVSGEVEYNHKRYFKVDSQWYAYRDSLDNTINEKLADINFQSILPSFLLKDWNYIQHQGEGAFNESFIQEQGFIVTDRTFMNNIEVSDLIRITDDEILFYHVKKGLGQDMRVLSNQIINASRYLKSAIDETSNSSLIKYYNSISKKHYNNNNISGVDFQGNAITYNQAGFIALLKSRRKMSFVFVYATNSIASITDEITATNSRIAKLALLYTFRDMKRTDFDFKMQRINLLNS
jgi:uncharacterized protein (TIGR04141 family)